MKSSGRDKIMCAGWLFFLCACLSARANVYATDIHLNGSLQSGVVVPGNPLTISFILNDIATNVSVQIYSGTNVLKTFTSDLGEVGTNAGLNTVVWDGTNNDGSAAIVGVCNVRITAAAAGYDTWTNITDDGPNFFVNVPTGITVNKNTNSPYYGRVFVGNGYDPGPGGMANGIFKFNADGSLADEGGFSTGEYTWGNGGLANPSPWKMAISADDILYVEDWQNNGIIVSFDQEISSNNSSVLRPDNYPYPSISLSGPWVCGAGTNTQIFMADINPTNLGGLGIIRWMLGANGEIATNDIGTVVVTETNNSDLTLAPFAVSVDTNGNIYTIQCETNGLYAPVLDFPPFLDGSPPDTATLWQAGLGNSSLFNAYGVAADRTASFVAVASRGFGDPEFEQDGGVSIFLAASGSLVTNITQDPAGNTNQEMIDVAWDNVGNLYALDASDSVWRIYSPPRSNQATTVAVPFIQVYTAITPPQLSQPVASLGQLNFTLLGQSNITYIIQQSPDLINWTPVATNFSLTSVLPVSISPPDTQDFYRAVTSP